MRRRNLLAVVVVLAGSLGPGVVSCVFNFDVTNCDDYPMVGCSGVSTSGGGHDGGTGGGSPDGCDPSKTSKPVVDSCGVFVSPTGSDGNAGTKEKPLKTITAALAKNATVYACAGAAPFSEAVMVSKAATLYGALDCASWVYDESKKTQLTAKADAVPLTLASAATGVEVVDFKIIAADAMMSGGSSIAVVADHATVTFTRCDLLAGDAKDGDLGTSGGMPAMQAAPGLAGDNAGTMGSSSGGNGGKNATCNLNGGNGGNGGSIVSGPGQDGQAGDNGNGGAKGTGDIGPGCSNGTNGSKATSGMSGGKGRACTPRPG